MNYLMKYHMIYFVQYYFKYFYHMERLIGHKTMKHLLQYDVQYYVKYNMKYLVKYDIISLQEYNVQNFTRKIKKETEILDQDSKQENNRKYEMENRKQWEIYER
eukprot:93916_1